MTAPPCAAQGPKLDEVLKRAARYVAGFHQQLTGIVAEETYTQTVDSTLSTRGNATRTLKSDLILVRLGNGDRYVELRDVFEVDGRSVRDREARLERLLGDDSAAAGDRLRRIIRESARYNIGTIERNINTPLLPLMFLQDDYQDDFRFKHVPGRRQAFEAPADRSFNDTPVFRASTEMWAIEFQERGSFPIIRDTRGGGLPAQGRFWINPENGAVLISELVVDGGGVKATVTVSYQTEPLMGFLAPVEMRESYVRSGERITGHAVYGRFRSITPRAR
jgi:hypothetical protein